MIEAPFANETIVVPERDAAPVELPLDMDTATARGVYSNLVLISHSRDEFTLEFAYMQPNHRALVQSRVILPATQVHELAHALLDQLDRRDERFSRPASDPGDER